MFTTRRGGLFREDRRAIGSTPDDRISRVGAEAVRIEREVRAMCLALGDPQRKRRSGFAMPPGMDANRACGVRVDMRRTASRQGGMESIPRMKIRRHDEIRSMHSPAPDDNQG